MTSIDYLVTGPRLDTDLVSFSTRFTHIINLDIFYIAIKFLVTKDVENSKVLAGNFGTGSVAVSFFSKSPANR